jgi:hypothetical protein
MMKTKIYGTFAAGFLMAFMFATPVRAQMPGTAMRATIPFDFTVREKVLPAGTYQIQRLGEQADVLVIKNIKDNHEQEVLLTQSTTALDVYSRTELVFQRYGDRYFLSKILIEGRQIGREVIPSRAERQLRTEISSNAAERVSVKAAID